jgi:tetratricopeptide (TPR) repeat protein
MLNLAIILFQKLGKYEKARYYANRVLEMDPHNPSAFVILGLVNEKLEEYDDAIIYLKLSSRID